MNSVPVLNSFLKVAGTFELTSGATIQSPPTVLIHIKLHSIPYVSHYTMTREALGEFYYNANRLRTIEMPFNVPTDRAAVKWNNDVAKQIGHLSGYTHIVIFVTTHSVPDNGDLWLGETEPQKPIATNVATVITSLSCHLIQILTVT
jgi:hypothetical protein